MKAEVIAIGDELTSGVRLDTNSQWISHQLEQLGLHVHFQTTVGDDLGDLQLAFAAAIDRVDVVIVTGGLGPTSDDLTRQAIAQVAGVELKINRSVLDHIENMYRSRNLEMPAANEIQAWFPEGSDVIPNPEGTAPGIAIAVGTGSGATTRLFALPGVPAEMKQMWRATLEPQLRDAFGLKMTTHHFTLHCFGAGESTLQEQLSDLLERGRDPLVGITASAATISLRVATRGKDQDACLEKMQPTIDAIRQRLGDLVFGENGQQLEGRVVELLRQQQRKIRVIDFGLHGEVARRLSVAEMKLSQAGPAHEREVISSGESRRAPADLDVGSLVDQLNLDDREIAIAIGGLNRNPIDVDAGRSRFQFALRDGLQTEITSFRYAGHSSWRETRAVKDVLNAIRLHLGQR